MEKDIEISYINPTDNKAYKDFSGSNTARIWTEEGVSTSQFFKKDNSSMSYLGWHGLDIIGEYETDTFDPPILHYRFPFNVGDSWESVSDWHFKYSDIPFLRLGTITFQVRVLARNSVTVTVGGVVKTYDNCYLIKTEETDVYSDHDTEFYTYYDWMVPGIGRVAFGNGYELGGSITMKDLAVFVYRK